jgi:hypothetical protein
MVEKGLFRIYMSHPIRGAKGRKATAEDMYKNCMNTQRVATEIRAYLYDWFRMHGDVPRIDLYVPAEHDEFIQIAYDEGQLTVEQILDNDCVIVGRCNMLIAYGPISEGMKQEIDYAQAHNIPIFAFKTWSKFIPQQLLRCIKLCIKDNN